MSIQGAPGRESTTSVSGPGSDHTSPSVSSTSPVAHPQADVADARFVDLARRRTVSTASGTARLTRTTLPTATAARVDRAAGTLSDALRVYSEVLRLGHADKLPAALLDLQRAQLGLARVLSANAHAEILPPKVALLGMADRVRGTTLILMLSGHIPPATEDAHQLHAMLLCGQADHAMGVLDNLPRDEMPDLSYRIGMKEDALLTTYPSGLSMLAVSPMLEGGPKERAGMPHEALHMHHADRPGPSAAYDQVQQRNAERPRVLSRTAAASQSLRGGHDASSRTIDEYLGDACEVDAYVRHGAVSELVADAGTRFHAHAHGCGLELIGPLIAMIGGSLDVSGTWRQRLFEMLGPSDAGRQAVRLQPRAAPFPPLMNDILALTNAIDGLAGSQAFTGHDAIALRNAMERVDGALRSPKGQRQDPVAQLGTIASTLRAFHEEFVQRNGFAALAPVGSRSDARTYDNMKRAPWRLLDEFMDDAYSAIMDAKVDSGFADDIDAMREGLAIGERPGPEAVRSAVTRLVAALTGTNAEAWPADLQPEIHLFDAEATLPYMAGYNKGDLQERKMEFDKHSWQLHIPQEQLGESAKLESRLSVLAAKMTYSIFAIQREDQAIPAANVHVAASTGTLAPVMAAIKAIQPESAAVTESQPRGLVATLKSRVEATDWHQTEMAFHLGERSEVKEAAGRGRAGLQSDLVADPLADEALRAKSIARWNQTPVMIERAIKGVSATLSREAEETATVAAALYGTRFVVADFFAALPTRTQSNEPLQELHDAGVFVDGQLADEGVTRFFGRKLAGEQIHTYRAFLELRPTEGRNT